MNAQERRNHWLQLNASWHVEVKRLVVFKSEGDLKRVISLIGDHRHPLYMCPFEYTIDPKRSIILPKLVFNYLREKKVAFRSATTLPGQ